MRRTTNLRATWAVALGLLTLAGSVQAAPPGQDKEKDKDKQVRQERRRVVVVNENGKEKVIELDGLGMRRGYLGVGLTDLTPELRTHFGVPEDAGVMISKVEPGSPAETAGVRVGDILTAVDGKEIKSSWDVQWKIRAQEEGQPMPVEIWRNGKVQTLSATIEKRERSEVDMTPFFFKDEDGDRILFRLDRDKLLGDRPGSRIPGPRPDGHLPGEGPRVRFERLGPSPREAELEKHLKALEKRIAELEKQLQKNK
ncbi:MAG TPA: PDZ domain-containing protein [Thermoanaerobaculia bacterium]|nr:PDZ domain-containing protein [Thermoanaerobaculia bacterium]